MNAKTFFKWDTFIMEYGHAADRRFSSFPKLFLDELQEYFKR